MRNVYLILLVLFIVIAVLFAVMNFTTVDVNLLFAHINAPLALVIAVSYVLGMLSGWSVFGLLKKSWSRVREQKKN